MSLHDRSSTQSVAYMIARPQICFRCQHRLARRSLPLKPRVAFLNIQVKHQQSSTVPDEPQEHEEEPHAPIKRPLKLSRRPLGSPKHVSEYPLGKLYGYTGQKLRENREKLSVDVLGETAEVIVLRDSRFNNYNSQTYEEAVENQQGVDILAKLDEERGLVGWEEVESNINEFRPSQGRHSQTREQFSELLTGLQNGFTVLQLARYLRVHGRKDLADPEPITTSLALRISPWMPGISESDERLDNDHLRGYDLESYTTKQRLVLRILRECWKVELLFVEEGVGQIEAELNPMDLDILLNGRTSALSTMHSDYIVDREERLEIFRSNDSKRSRNAIRITSTRTKCQFVLQEIEQVLKGINRIRLPLKALMPQPKQGEQYNLQKWASTHFDKSIIKEIARLTNTEIRRTPGCSLLITSVDINACTAISNKSDTARRLATTLNKSPDREISWIGCKDTPMAAKGIFVKYALTEGLAWHERLLQWSRWVTPISKDGEIEDQIKKMSQEDESLMQTQPQILKGPEVQHEVGTIAPEPDSVAFQGKPQTGFQLPLTERPASIALWSEGVSVQSSALLGTILYAQHRLPSTAASQNAPLFADTTRSFSTAVPGISRILATAFASNIKPTESIVMRFSPNPFFSPSTKQTQIGAAALSAFPPIEMRFAVDSQTRAMGLNFVHATISNQSSDLMLPDSPMDIRFQQKTTSRLYCNQQSLPPGIAEFLDKSNLSLDFSQGGLQTPPSLQIPIAPHLCTKDAFRLLGSDINDVGMQDVEYLFAGLEVRKTIATEFEGWRLLYTSVEAGKAGGRRGELRLRPTRTVESDDPTLETEEAFLETAFKLVDASYSTITSRKVMNRLVKRVGMSRDKDEGGSDRMFKYFAKRPIITLDWQRNSRALGDQFEEELLDEDDVPEKDEEHGGERPAS